MLPSSDPACSARPKSPVFLVPRTEAEVDQAEQATDYVNYVFWNDNPGFLNLYGAIKDALTVKTGFLKWWYGGSPGDEAQALSERPGRSDPDDPVGRSDRQDFRDWQAGPQSPFLCRRPLPGAAAFPALRGGSSPGPPPIAGSPLASGLPRLAARRRPMPPERPPMPASTLRPDGWRAARLHCRQHLTAAAAAGLRPRGDRVRGQEAADQSRRRAAGGDAARSLRALVRDLAHRRP